jgi:hypothetical protein
VLAESESVGVGDMGFGVFGDDQESTTVPGARLECIEPERSPGRFTSWSIRNPEIAMEIRVRSLGYPIESFSMGDFFQIRQQLYGFVVPAMRDFDVGTKVVGRVVAFVLVYMGVGHRSGLLEESLFLVPRPERAEGGEVGPLASEGDCAIVKGDQSRRFVKREVELLGGEVVAEMIPTPFEHGVAPAELVRARGEYFEAEELGVAL